MPTLIQCDMSTYIYYNDSETNASVNISIRKIAISQKWMTQNKLVHFSDSEQILTRNVTELSQLSQATIFNFAVGN